MRVEICQPNLSLGSLTSLERELGVPNSMEGEASRSKTGRSVGPALQTRVTTGDNKDVLIDPFTERVFDDLLQDEDHCRRSCRGTSSHRVRGWRC